MSGACGILCDAGFGNCNGDPLDGCAEALGVDDSPEVRGGCGGVWVPPDLFKRSGDQGMTLIYRIVCDCKATGTSEDKKYRKKGSTVPLF